MAYASTTVKSSVNIFFVAAKIITPLSSLATTGSFASFPNSVAFLLSLTVSGGGLF